MNQPFTDAKKLSLRGLSLWWPKANPNINEPIALEYAVQLAVLVRLLSLKRHLPVTQNSEVDGLSTVIHAQKCFMLPRV